MRFLQKISVNQKGNALLYVFIAIALLASLTYSVSKSNDDPQFIADYSVADEQIARMMTYTGTLSATLQQMVLAGAKPETLYTTLSVIPPSNAGFPTAPHNMKIFHPMGGGMNYVTSTGATTSSDTVATAFNINKGSIIDKVGPTDATVGDILFTAKISSSTACARINYLLRGSSTVPVLATATFDNLFTTGSTVTINAGNCAACVAVAQNCVSNTGATAWGYYAALFPG